jgi:class 3 adenylate cyclase
MLLAVAGRFCDTVQAQERVRVRSNSSSVIDSLKGVLPTTEGAERIKTLRALAWEQRRFDLAQSLDFALQAVDAARASSATNIRQQLPPSLNVLGVAYRNIANYPKAMEAFLEALRTATELNVPREEGYAYNNIGDVYRMQRNYAWAIENTEKSLAIFERIGDKQGMAYCYMRLGENGEAQGQYDMAYTNYLRCYDLRRQLADTTAMYVALSHVGDIHRLQRRFGEALKCYGEALQFMKRNNATADVAVTLRRMASTHYEHQDYTQAIALATESLELSKSTNFKLDLQDAAEVLWKSYAALRQFEQAYQYQHLYLALRDSITSEQSVKKIAALQINYEVQRKDSELALVQENARLVRWGLGGGLAFALMLAAALYNRYRVKRDANHEILRQQQILQEKSREIELANNALQLAIQQADKLLLNVLPESIAERMKSGETRIAEQFPDAAVLFADIAGFTNLSAVTEPHALVDLLDGVFSEFDVIVAHYGVEKIKTIGDGYMVVAGIPKPLPNNARTLAFVALDMMQALTRFNRTRGTTLALRIGMHKGSVIAGVIGKHKFSYDLWGDTVNTASRMESHSDIGKIHCTQDIRDALKDEFVFEQRGEIEVKGKGVMRTWFLLGSEM